VWLPQVNLAKWNWKGLIFQILKKDKWYIFTLEKTGSNLKWKINDTEVVNMHQSKINFPLHMNLLSMVVDQVPGSNLPATFPCRLGEVLSQKMKEINAAPTGRMSFRELLQFATGTESSCT
jgi:hypothetical protein